MTSALSPLSEGCNTRHVPKDEITFASALALAKAIRLKDLSSVEVVEAYLKRIEVGEP